MVEGSAMRSFPVEGCGLPLPRARRGDGRVRQSWAHAPPLDPAVASTRCGQACPLCVGVSERRRRAAPLR